MRIIHVRKILLLADMKNISLLVEAKISLTIDSINAWTI